jgi:hypothetical protein
MTKPPNKVQGNESELYPGARQRFEHAVDVVIKSGPKHRQAPPANPSYSPNRHTLLILFAT